MVAGAVWFKVKSKRIPPSSPATKGRWRRRACTTSWLTAAVSSGPAPFLFAGFEHTDGYEVMVDGELEKVRVLSERSASR